jgi:hypothetical protein
MSDARRSVGSRASSSTEEQQVVAGFRRWRVCNDGQPHDWSHTEECRVDVWVVHSVCDKCGLVVEELEER